MKFNIFVSMVIATLLLITGCSHQPSYLVSVHKIDGSNQIEFDKYYQKSKLLLSKKQGQYLDLPLMIDEELPNGAMPAVTTDFPGNRILVAKFPNRKILDSYLKNKDVQESMDTLASATTNESFFIASEFNPMGMLTTPPELGSVKHGEEPAFIMVNAFSFKTMLNPINPFRIMKYMNANTPYIESAGVNILMPFEKIEDVRGNFEFQALFFTEWPSREIFDHFHKDERFIELSKKTRNKAVDRFTESKAHIMRAEYK